MTEYHLHRILDLTYPLAHRARFLAHPQTCIIFSHSRSYIVREVINLRIAVVATELDFTIRIVPAALQSLCAEHNLFSYLLSGCLASSTVGAFSPIIMMSGVASTSSITCTRFTSQIHTQLVSEAPPAVFFEMYVGLPHAPYVGMSSFWRYAIFPLKCIYSRTWNFITMNTYQYLGH